MAAMLVYIPTACITTEETFLFYTVLTILMTVLTAFSTSFICIFQPVNILLKGIHSGRIRTLQKGIFFYCTKLLSFDTSVQLVQ